MTEPIKLDTSDSQFIISIDKDAIDKKTLLKYLESLRLELLAREVDFDEDIERLGEEIKAKWWAKNKDRFIPKEEQ